MKCMLNNFCKMMLEQEDKKVKMLIMQLMQKEILNQLKWLKNKRK
jgi:hypothetical protein